MPLSNAKKLIISVLTMVFLLTLEAPTSQINASAQKLGKMLIIQSIFVSDAENRPQRSFQTGDQINYRMDITNSSGHTLDGIKIGFYAYRYLGNTTLKFPIIRKEFNVSLPAGLNRFYTMSSIPRGAGEGSYQFSGSVSQNSNTSEVTSKQSSNFSVKRIFSYPLQIPYYSQFDVSNRNEECGPTTVAMVISYFLDLLNTSKERITQVRQVIAEKFGNRMDGTNYQQLVYSLADIGHMESALISNQNTVDTAVASIKGYVSEGSPIIAFVDGRKLGRTYGGHWLVIRGIIGDTVYVNDPDSSYGGTNVAAPTTLTLADYEAAAQYGVKDQNQPYGIAVQPNVW